MSKLEIQGLDLLGFVMARTIEATQASFRTQIRIEAKFRTASSAPPVETAASSAISFESNDVAATIAFFFPAETFCALYSALVGETTRSVTDENLDAAAEILNIVYGVARKPINESGHDFRAALPVAHLGASARAAHVGSSARAIICESSLGPILMEFSLRRKSIDAKKAS